MGLEWIQVACTLIASLFMSGAVYGAMRADLKNIREKTSDVQSTADRAHQRIDDHIERHHTK